jgi:hypothetical protein
MMARPISETTAWVSQIMREKRGVNGVEQVSDRSIRISRDRHPPYVAGIISTRNVTDADVNAVLEEDPNVDIIINVPSAGVWQGSGIFATQRAGVAFGGMGDLQSCIDRENPSDYVKAEYEFIERGLSQHNRVTTIVREADRLFLLFRNGLPEIRVLALYEYELTADHLRTARARYGNFDLVLISNPNGRPTEGAANVAETLGIELLMFGELLSRLNR